MSTENWNANSGSISTSRKLAGQDKRTLVPGCDPWQLEQREYIAHLLRRTVRHNGPVKRHEIDAWLRRDAVDEFLELLYP
jgi:hypothetical protein